MSLIAWFPLNGDLKNHGASLISLTESKSHQYLDGKIGKAINISSSYLKTNNEIISNGMVEYSFSMWIYNNCSITGCLACCRNNIGDGLAIFLINGDIVRVDSGTSTNQWNTEIRIPKNKWTHLTYTRSKSEQIVYINGEIKKRDSNKLSESLVNVGTIFTIGASQHNGTEWNNYFNGLINDYRFYDHALSKYEVKEVAEAKILEYNFNSEYSSMDETVLYDGSGYGNNANCTNIIGAIDDSIKDYCGLFGNNIYAATFNKASEFMPTDSVSLVLYAYMDNWGSYGRAVSCTEAGGLNFEPIDDKMQFTLYRNGTGYIHAVDTVSLSSLTGWHMFVGTYDGYYIKLYRDGELISTAGIYSEYAKVQYANVKLYIGCEAAEIPTTPYFNGKVKSVKIYATALSADRIRQIYQAKQIIDKNGNLYARLRENKSGEYDFSDISSWSMIGWDGSKTQDGQWLVFTAKNGWRSFAITTPSELVGNDVYFSFDYEYVDKTNLGQIPWIFTADSNTYGNAIKSLADSDIGVQHRMVCLISNAKAVIGINVRGTDGTGKILSIRIKNISLSEVNSIKQNKNGIIDATELIEDKNIASIYKDGVIKVNQLKEV